MAFRKVLVVGVALLVVSSVTVAGLLATGMVEVAPPSVESVETSWGGVTDEQTTIETRVTVNNPNPVGVPSMLGISYQAEMNDVLLAEGEKSGIGIGTGEATIGVNATMDNDQIAEWWIEHVKDNETSSLIFAGEVTGPGGFSKSITREREFQTDLLSKMSRSGERTVTLDGDPFVVLSESTAEWGEVTETQTPVLFTTTIENIHDYGLTLDGIGYEVRMNDVVLGSGVDTDTVDIAPGETSSVTVEAGLNASKMSEWWPTHVRNQENSTMTVVTYGIIEEDGEQKRVPLEFIRRQVQFETDFLGDNGTETEALAGDGPDRSASNPTIVETEQQWGEVTSSVTPVLTTVTLNNSNSEAMTDLMELESTQRMQINDVLVAEDTATRELETGVHELTLPARMDNSKVPQWWARHVNRGESSTVETQTNATADVQFTRLNVPVEDERGTMETDLLSSLNNSTTSEYQLEGETVLVVDRTSAEWQEATTQRSPFVVTVQVENVGNEPVDLEDLQYTIDLNDVRVGNGTAPESYTIQPGEQRTVTFTLVIDSQRMDEWWVSHVRNNERSVIDFDASLRIASSGRSDRVAVGPLSTTDTVETDLLNATA